MFHFVLNSAVNVGPVHHSASLKVDQVFHHLRVCCTGGKEAPAQSLHPIVVPYVASRVDETGGGLDVLQLFKDVGPYCGRMPILF